MWWDTWIVDGAVRFGSFFVKMLSYPVCILQTGRVQAYALLRGGRGRWCSSGITSRGNHMDQHLLSIVLLTPLAGLVVLLFIPVEEQEPDPRLGQPGRLRRVPGLAAAGVRASRTGVAGFQFEERADWIPTLGAHYHIGIDGISLLLVMLTTLMGFIAMLCSWNADRGPASRNTTPCSCCCRRA